MNNIKRLIKDDVYKVTHNLFALVIAIGICILPALYAWLNIYSNWDPYGNTGNLDLAVISLDKGCIDEEEYKNVGNEVIEDLKGSDSVKWHFVDTADEAREGVESGEYYAAVVIGEDFTYNMYNVFTKKVDKPQIIFYQNQKKNPVANKISDTVVEKIQTKINQKFVKVIATQVFGDVNEISEDIEKEGGVDGLIDKMKKVSDDLNGYQNLINTIINGNAVLKAAIDSAQSESGVITDKINSSANALQESHDSLVTTQDTLNTYKYQVDLVIATVQGCLTDISNRLSDPTILNDTKALNNTVKTTQNDIKIIRTDLTALEDALTEAIINQKMTLEQRIEAQATIKTVRELNSRVDRVEGTIGSMDAKYTGDTAINILEDEEADLKAKIDEVQGDITSSQITINSTLIPQVNDTLNNLELVLADATTLMRQMGSTMSGMNKVYDSLNVAVNAGNISLKKTNDAIAEINKRLSKVIDKVEKATQNEKVQVMMDTLSGDPELYGEFFSEPVVIETTAVYPVENYGSAVSPFYTVLALWVGAIILAAIVNIKPDRSKYFYMRDHELFFGRYFMYFILGQLQALITVVGDIAIFKVQCLHPILFYLASAFTSLVFSMLIYALVVAFSDVGKAIAVVILVLQVAGSSGTYPIELLPEFFQNVYLFFPFPYAINALRECVAGLYEMDYIVYLLELSLFLVLGLVIGLWIRKPFKSLKNYFEKRMEDTEML